jgi:hypothetical protein
MTELNEVEHVAALGRGLAPAPVSSPLCIELDSTFPPLP